MHIILVYIGILAGAFFEGEMVMLSSVIAAHHGFLNLWLVIILGVSGTYSADCFYFFLGRRKGEAWINLNPKIKNKADIIEKKLLKFPILIFIGYRFMYGFRSITPLVIGASKTRTETFLLFSALSTLIWACVYCALGYMSGEIIKSELGHIEHIEKYIIGVLILFGIFFFLGRHVIKKYKKNIL